MRAISIVLALWATACSVDIRSGYYGCVVREDCPAAAPYCRSDNRCHSTPGETERDSGMPPPFDSGPPPPDSGPPPDGSRPCAANGDCALPGALCIERACRRPCVRGGPACDAGEECISATANGEHRVVCLPISIASMGNYAPCTGGVCPAPFECIQGNCLRDCNGTMDACLMPELCVMDPTMRRACVVTCPGGGACPPDSRCARPPGVTTDVCIAW